MKNAQMHTINMHKYAAFLCLPLPAPPVFFDPTLHDKMYTFCVSILSLERYGSWRMRDAIFRCWLHTYSCHIEYGDSFCCYTNIAIFTISFIHCCLGRICVV